MITNCTATRRPRRSPARLISDADARRQIQIDALERYRRLGLELPGETQAQTLIKRLREDDPSDHHYAGTCRA